MSPPSQHFCFKCISLGYYSSLLQYYMSITSTILRRNSLTNIVLLYVNFCLFLAMDFVRPSGFKTLRQELSHAL